MQSFPTFEHVNWWIPNIEGSSGASINLLRYSTIPRAKLQSLSRLHHPQLSNCIHMASPFSQDVSNAVATLCERCQDALSIDDTSREWEEVCCDNGIPRLKSHFPRPCSDEKLDDQLPDLPKLLRSAERGCGFCAFLRDAILSEDMNDVFTDAFGRNISESVSHLIHIGYTYSTTLSNRISVPPSAEMLTPTRGKDSLLHHPNWLDGIQVHLEVDKVEFELEFPIEADPGEEPWSSCMGSVSSNILQSARKSQTGWPSDLLRNWNMETKVPLIG